MRVVIRFIIEKVYEQIIVLYKTFVIPRNLFNTERGQPQSPNKLIGTTFLC